MRVLLPTPLLLILLLRTDPAFAVVNNDFSPYPEGAQACLYDSADDAGCKSGSTGADLNNCLCKNRNNFIYNSASCIARESPSDLEAVYETLKSNCEGTGVTLSVSEEAFLAAADASTQTSSVPIPTSTVASTSTVPSPTGSPGEQDTDNGLSTGTKIGIGVGVGFGAIAAGLAAWFVWAYQRRWRSSNLIHRKDSNGVSGEGVGSPYGDVGAFIATNELTREYAQDNTQQGATELAPDTWRPPVGYGLQGFTGSENKGASRAAGVPLLAELGSGPEARQNAVELPAAPGYLGYSDRAPNESVTSEAISPATYHSQGGRGDLSPYTPSRCSDGGTYT